MAVYHGEQDIPLVNWVTGGSAGRFSHIPLQLGTPLQMSSFPPVRNVAPGHGHYSLLFDQHKQQCRHIPLTGHPGAVQRLLSP